jgi:hypothetical protein
MSCPLQKPVTTCCNGATFAEVECRVAFYSWITGNWDGRFHEADGSCEASSDATLRLQRLASRRRHGAANRVATPCGLYSHVIVPKCLGRQGRLNAVRSSARVADLEDNRGVGQIPSVFDDVDQTSDEAPMVFPRRQKVTLAAPVGRSWSLGRTGAIEVRKGAARSTRPRSNAGVPDDPVGYGPVDHEFLILARTCLIQPSRGGWLEARCRCENRTS